MNIDDTGEWFQAEYEDHLQRMQALHEGDILPMPDDVPDFVLAALNDPNHVRQWQTWAAKLEAIGYGRDKAGREALTRLVRWLWPPA